MIRRKPLMAKSAWTTAIFFLMIVGVGIFLYYDRHSALSTVFRSWGAYGVAIAMIVMAIICMTPIPSEGLLILYLKIYGPWLGVFYSWIGSIISTVAVFIIARRLGKPILESMVSNERFDQLNRWVEKKGIPGLLIVRLLPIPGFVVSYVIGTMPSIRLWNFVWTAAVTIIPYYTGATLMFLGISKRATSWLALGCLALVLFWLLAYFARKRWGSKLGT